MPHEEAAFFFTDIFLNLTGVNAVEDRSVAIHAANSGMPIIACAPLVNTEVRRAVQLPSMYVEARQASPYDTTTVITTSYLPSNMLTILTDALNTYNLCPVDGAVYNPFTAQSGNTPDLLPVGSLYQKYQAELNSSNTFAVTELPIYGVNTITSRTLRINSENRRICSALSPTDNPGTSPNFVGVASFSGPLIEGNIIFVSDNWCFAYI